MISFQSRVELPVFQCCHSSEVLNVTNLLNIKIRKESFKDFLVPLKRTGANGYWDFQISDLDINPDGTDI